MAKPLVLTKTASARRAAVTKVEISKPTGVGSSISETWGREEMARECGDVMLRVRTRRVYLEVEERVRTMAEPCAPVPGGLVSGSVEWRGIERGDE